MSASEELLGRDLPGFRLKKSWRVVEKFAVIPDQTPGRFSVGYRVSGEAGREAFLKASDLGMFGHAGEDALTRLQRAVNAHSFERQILDHCSGSNMDRVVTAIDYGDIEVDTGGIRDRVFYLVFELAKGDLRKRVRKDSAYDLLWSVNALHNFAIAISQLHIGDVSHNDLKPANALVFSDALQKVGDLGRAITRHIPAAHDNMQCAGDQRFAPPEQLYPSDLGDIKLSSDELRQAGDIYNFGSLIHFLLAGRMVTPEVLARLRPEHRPLNRAGGWQDSFAKALPYWRAAFVDVLVKLPRPADDGGALAGDASEQLVRMITQLCEPDPMSRGHPRNRSGAQRRFGLERYITQLDSLRQRLALKV